MKFSLDSFIKAAVGIVADNHAAGTHNGTGIDRKGFEEALIVVNSGVNGSSGTVDIKVQESSDNSTFTDISGAAFTQITESNDNNVYAGRLNLDPISRYIRVVAVVATAACDFGVDVILGAPKQLPVSQVNDVAFSL